MKISIITLGTIITLFASATILTSCGGESSTESGSSEQHEMDGHNHDEMSGATFSCPMHAEITGKEGDKCSKCGMFLTKSEDNEHKMDAQVFKCPMHPDETGVKGDKCSKCGMDLVASETTAIKMSMKECKHKVGEKCSNCTTEMAATCKHKTGEKCTKCSKHESMKCDHKKGESCPMCKKV